MSRDRAQWLEVAALVARSAPVDFELRLDGLSRLAPALTRADGVATGQFRFHRVAGPAAFDAADGTVSAKLALTCQRCLGEVEIAIAEQCSLAFIDEEANDAGLPSSHDPVVMTQGRVELAELVEEQLLLAMPQVPMHPSAGECERQAARRSVDAVPGTKPAAEPTQRPFAGLRELMKK